MFQEKQLAYTFWAMRALVYTAPGKVEMQERPRPDPQKGEEEIAVEVAGVCGSDISGFLGHSALRRPPLVLGHELVGRLRDGRRVVANPLVSCGRCGACLSGAQNLCDSWTLLGLGTTSGTFTEFVALPGAQVYEIPDSLTAEQAILAEPLANIVHMFRIVSPPAFFRLAIVGAGTMGVLTLLAGLRIGARDVLAADVNDQRIETMLKLGASSTVNATKSESLADVLRMAGRGYDVVIDASGSAAARQMAFDFCRPGGQVVLLGMGIQRSEINFVPSIRKEHRVVMSFAYTPVDFRRSLDLLIAGEVSLTPWTVKMPLESGQEALDRMSHNPGVALKMMLEVAAH
ncbi:putative chlorophyll synthesis pathway protein BchC [Acidobacteriia bacterium SbA2]|nr:putative chlorophyll synthesis pathway protein BchC [Acidobacteriia bacterium SbA2]